MHSELYQFWMMVIFKHASHPPAWFLTESKNKSENMKTKIAITNKPKPNQRSHETRDRPGAQSHLGLRPHLIWAQGPISFGAGA